jgi:hypothetical protein
MPFSPNRHIPDADGGQGRIPNIPLPDPTIYAPQRPLQLPFPPGSIPGPPEGMTIPPRQPLPIQQPTPERPPWLGPAPDPNGPGWESAPPIDRDEQLRRDFQEKMFPPPPLNHEIYDKKLAQGGNQPPPIS